MTNISRVYLFWCYPMFCTVIYGTMSHRSSLWPVRILWFHASPVPMPATLRSHLQQCRLYQSVGKFGKRFSVFQRHSVFGFHLSVASSSWHRMYRSSITLAIVVPIVTLILLISIMLMQFAFEEVFYPFSKPIIKNNNNHVQIGDSFSSIFVKLWKKSLGVNQ